MSNISWLDNLKMRLSYGMTGNNQIPNYGAIGLLGYSSYVSGTDVKQGIYTNTFADKELNWEKTGQTNLGIDASVLNQRVNFSLDVYYSKTRDLLLNVPIPVLTGFQSTLTNIGELQNKGIEFQLRTLNLNGNFKWTTDFNISANRNEIVKLGANDAPIYITVNDAICESPGSGQTNVIEKISPQAYLSGDTTVCASQKAILHFSLSGNGPWTLYYKKDKGSVDSLYVNQNVTTYNYSLPVSLAGNYILTGVKDTEQAGCAFNSANIKHFDIPRISFSGHAKMQAPVFMQVFSSTTG